MVHSHQQYGGSDNWCSEARRWEFEYQKEAAHHIQQLIVETASAFWSPCFEECRLMDAGTRRMSVYGGEADKLGRSKAFYLFTFVHHLLHDTFNAFELRTHASTSTHGRNGIV
jgi:hypothetical protein